MLIYHSDQSNRVPIKSCLMNICLSNMYLDKLCGRPCLFQSLHDRSRHKMFLCHCRTVGNAHCDQYIHQFLKRENQLHLKKKHRYKFSVNNANIHSILSAHNGLRFPLSYIHKSTKKRTNRKTWAHPFY